MERVMTRLGIIACAILAAAAAASAQSGTQTKVPPEPAQFVDGSLPGIPPFSTAGGNVVLSVIVAADGHVTGIDVLRSTPPFTDALVQAVKTWRFAAAVDSKKVPVESRVMVSSIIRPPALYAQAVGTPPQDITNDSRVPFPAQMTTPNYPVNANGGGMVLVESHIDASGRVIDASAIRSQPPFDEPALQAARATTFRPPQGTEVPPTNYAYVVFVFRAPVVGAGAPGTGGLNLNQPSSPSQPFPSVK
jgi:TonB family protein